LFALRSLYLPDSIGASIKLDGISYQSYSVCDYKFALCRCVFGFFPPHQYRTCIPSQGFEEQFEEVSDEVRELSFKAENVQRKITPWSEMAVEEEFDDRYGQLLKYVWCVSDHITACLRI
jgi:hypothetical protein